MIRRFELHRIDIELAAMIKYRRMLTSSPVIGIDADDLREVAPPTTS
jgi:hypothetical protein